MLLIFDAISPSTIGLLGLIGNVYIVILLVLICLRDKRKRTGPTRKEIAMMISICAIFSIPIIVINQLMVEGLIEPTGMNSPIVIVPIVMFLVVLYSLVLIVVYGTQK